MKTASKRDQLYKCTSHFSSFGEAVRYYRTHGLRPIDVETKLNAREIFIGRPSCGPNQSVYLDRTEGRYFILG